MAQPQQIPYPPNPYRYSYPYPPTNLENLKLPQSFLPQTPIPPNTTPNNNIPAGNFYPSRMYNPYFPPYGMMYPPPYPPYPPYMPMMRPPQIFGQVPQISKNSGQPFKKSIVPPVYFDRTPSTYLKPPPIQSPISSTVHSIPAQDSIKNVSKTRAAEQRMVKKPLSTQIRQQSSSQNQTRVNVQQSKQKSKPVRQIKHSDVKLYEPEPPKKKLKKQEIPREIILTRETREKKQNIQKIMQKVMKQKTLKDRIIKIGKQYQAHIPQSFINQYQYNLKIKLQKKKNLMSRLIA